MFYEKLMQGVTSKLVRILSQKAQRRLALVKQYALRGYGELFYGQDGIDAILKVKLREYKRVFYVDVGANHPFWASNTYLFYRDGGRGINIDATPSTMDLFKIARRRDINLELSISSSTKVKKFYVFESTAINGFEESLPAGRVKSAKINQVIQLQPVTLAKVLDKHLPPRQIIHFLTIDTEGNDLDVLQSNNWKKYRPLLIVVEQFVESVNELSKTKIHALLSSQGYTCVAYSGMNAVYESKESLAKRKK